MALSAIYDSLPTERSLEILAGDDLWPQTLRRIASTALAHSQRNDGKRLDPQGRDHLLRRLAVFAPTDPHVDGDLLAALRSYPIRDGGQLLADLAAERSMSVDARGIAVMDLQTVSDFQAVQSTVQLVVQEPSLDLQTKLLELAVTREVALPREWLEHRITQECHSWRRGTLTAAYVHAANLAEEDDLIAFCRFLSLRIAETLAADTDETDVISHELASALSRPFAASRLRVQASLQEPARRFLESFRKKRIAASAGQVRLATTLLRVATQPWQRNSLSDTLKELLRRIRLEKDKGLRLQLEAQAMDVARTLADVAVERLLMFPSDSEPVREVLAERSRDSGWLVFADYILDANGQRIANLSNDTSPDPELASEAVQTLVEGLPDAMKQAILSRWLVVGVFKLQPPSCPEKDIHHHVGQLQAGEGDAQAAEWMQGLYPDRVPPFKNWRQYMYRAADKLRKSPAGAAFLSDLGLK